MTIIYKKTETTFFILPRDVSQFITFLGKRRFNPKWDGDGIVQVSKPFDNERLRTAWRRETGVDKTIAKLLVSSS